jgi:hypothetical protein
MLWSSRGRSIFSTLLCSTQRYIPAWYMVSFPTTESIIHHLTINRHILLLLRGVSVGVPRHLSFQSRGDEHCLPLSLGCNVDRRPSVSLALSLFCGARNQAEWDGCPRRFLESCPPTMLTASRRVVYVRYVLLPKRLIYFATTTTDAVDSIYEPCERSLDRQRDRNSSGYNWSVRDDAMHFLVRSILLPEVCCLVVCSKCTGSQFVCICGNFVCTSYVSGDWRCRRCWFTCRLDGSILWWVPSPLFLWSYDESKKQVCGALNRVRDSWDRGRGMRLLDLLWTRNSIDMSNPYAIDKYSSIMIRISLRKS